MDETEERDFIKQFAALKSILNKKKKTILKLILYKIKEYISVYLALLLLYF